MAMLLASASLVACSDNTLFLQLPELDPSTKTVILAIECPMSLQVRVYDPAELSAEAIDLDECDSAWMTVLEYPESLDDVDLPPGPVSRQYSTVCTIASLPEAPITRVARVEAGESDGFIRLDSRSNLPGDLPNFRYRRPCPCRDLRVEDQVPFPPANQYFVQAEPSGSFLVFASGLGPDHAVSVYRTDLSSVELLTTATIAIDRGENALRVGLNGVVPGPIAGEYYLVGDLSQILRYTNDEGVKLFATVPGDKEIARIGVSKDEPIEIFATNHHSEIWRYRPSEGWFQYPYPPNFNESSQRTTITWIDRGRALVTPELVNELAFCEGDGVTVEEWTPTGAIHAVSEVPGFGVIAGTRRNQFFRIDVDQPGVYEELLGPSGLRMDPIEAWFQQISPIEGGFVASADGPDTFVSFHEDWGYCPLKIIDEEIGLTGFAVHGDTILMGGPVKFLDKDPPIPTPEIVRLPVLRFAPK